MATSLHEAQELAQRFLRLAKELEHAQEPERYSSPLESGALKRASMDLTRALAKYRKNNGR